MEVKVEPRLWRPAAQRNIRNALGYIQAQYSVWCKTSAAARAVATNLVNAYLSHSDVDVMDLGVLGGVNGIRGRAKAKLLAQQEICLEQFLRHYDALRLLAVAFHNMVFQRTKLKNSREEQSVWPWRTISTKAPPLIWDKDDDLDDCTVTEGTAHPSSRETLQVYLTALLAEVNVNKWRVEEILRQWDDEMTSQ